MTTQHVDESFAGDFVPLSRFSVRWNSSWFMLLMFRPVPYSPTLLAALTKILGAANSGHASLKLSRFNMLMEV